MRAIKRLLYTDLGCSPVPLGKRCIAPNPVKDPVLIPRISRMRVKRTSWPSPLARCLLSSLVFLPLICSGVSASAQQNPLPSFRTEYTKGVEALRAGKLDEAEQIFLTALRQGNRHPLVYHNLGVIAQQRGQHQEAVRRFHQALSVEPDFGPSHLLLGSSLLALGKNGEALRELERAAKLLPDEPEAMLLLAKAEEAAGNWIAAVDQLQKLVALAPGDLEYCYQLGRGWSKLSGWSYQQISRIDSHSARLQQGLGQEYAVQERYELALDAFQKAALADPNLPEIHLAIALICLELKKFDEALAAVELELKLVPESKAALEAKARIEAAKGTASP
jgi:tetratricopeptide (TPR) repeat protein